MKKIWKRLLVLLFVFIAAAAGFAVYLHIADQPEEDTPVYEVWEGATLPVLSTSAGTQEINLLCGYTSEIDPASLEDSVMPVEEDGKLTLRIQTFSNQIAGISYAVTSRDGSAEIVSGVLEKWTAADDGAECELPLQDLPEDEEARLTVTLTLGEGTEVSYYTRVLRGEELHETELLDYVTGFHAATFDKQAIEKYAANLETDGTADEDTLAETTIHSSLDQISYADLNPTAVGEPQITIQELDGTFGSFLLRYELQTEDAESGAVQTYLAEEFFCVQWSATRLYLMDYRRTITELFDADADSVSSGCLDLGIVDSEEVETVSSDDGSCLAFAVGNELWSLQKNSKKLTRIFTFRDTESDVRSEWRQHGVRILQAEDNGDVHFLVCGYMNRGQHEGCVGVSYLLYEEETGTCREIFFLPGTMSYELIKEGVDTLACMGEGGEVYLMLGDAVYSVDWEGQEIVALAENLREHNLIVNDDETAVAWEISEGDSQAGSVQILYLSTGESQVVRAGEGEQIVPQGFIGDDCILGIGRESDETVSGAVRLQPFYAVVIQSRDGTEAARYEYEDVYISSVTVSSGQIALERLEKTSSGKYSEIEGDTLIQNTLTPEEKKQTLLERSDSVKERTWYLDTGDSKLAGSDLDYQVPGGVLYAEQENWQIPSVSDMDENRYYAYGEGHLITVSSTAGEAIAAVSDQMGTVTDGTGALIWRRTSRQTTVELSVTEGSAGEGDGLAKCLQAFLALEGETRTSDVQLGEMSALEAMEALFPDSVLNLTGCDLRSLLYYVNRGHPVLIVETDGDARLLCGFDQYNVEYYDPDRGEIVRQGQQDAADWLAESAAACLSLKAGS